MTVRAKFRVDLVTKYENQGGAFVVLYPVGCGLSEENKAFWEATPAGRVEMSITNPDAATQFEEGQEYYIDFTPATSPTLDVQNCAACGNDHEDVPATATTADGTFQCPDSGQPVSYTNDGTPADVSQDPRNSI